jgi:HEAT repeat protein
MKASFLFGSLILFAALPLAAQEDLKEKARRAAEEARIEIERLKPEIAEKAREAAEEAREEAFRLAEKLKEGKFRFDYDFDFHLKPGIGDLIKDETFGYAMKAQKHAFDLAWQKMPSFDFAFQVRVPADAARGREEQFYRRGQSANDERDYERAAQAFATAASLNGPRADGALYWKAYALNKLGKREEALSALAELQKSHPSSRWLNDARVLELEVKQSSGRPISPEQESDEELKLYAINSLVHTEPDRALPLLEKIISTSTSPRLKDRAMFVLAQTRAPRAVELLTKMAQGGVNPDLQRKAVSYLGDAGGKAVLPTLAEIYSSSNDLALKRTILGVYGRHKDKERLLTAATSEAVPELRRDGIRHLGNMGANDELAKLYGAASDIESKTEIIRALHNRGGAEKLQEILKQERDPKLRVEAIRMLGSHDSAQTGELLVGIYSAESDPALRRAVISALSSHNNGKALVDLARKETDLQMKKVMIERLSRMRSKEANEYLLELLK